MVAGFYRFDWVWWYNFSAIPKISPQHSYTWGGSHNFFMFLSTRPRGTLSKKISELQVGDIVQADWDNTRGQHRPDGRIDHTMIVTGKSSRGEIFLTYHSNNTKDRSFTDLKKAEPKAIFYGWKLYNNPN